MTELNKRLQVFDVEETVCRARKEEQVLIVDARSGLVDVQLSILEGILILNVYNQVEEV